MEENKTTEKKDDEKMKDLENQLKIMKMDNIRLKEILNSNEIEYEGKNETKIFRNPLFKDKYLETPYEGFI
jgi:hypothetical protein